MKQIYTILFLFVCAVAWGQAGRLHRLDGSDTTVIATRSYADTYDNSSSGAAPTTKQGMLDSLAGFQSFADIMSIQAAYPRVGYRLEDRRTGIRYRVQSDSALYYSVDDSLVIDLSGKYAVADLSGKREFKSMSEFKRLAPLCGFTGKSEKVKIGELEIWITPTPILNATDPEGVTVTVDGTFLDTVQIAYTGQNILKSSTYQVPAGISFGWNFDPTYRLNYGISDKNRKEGVLLTGIVGSGTRDIYIYPVASEIQTAEYTLSFDMKVINASGSPYVRYDASNTVLLNTDGDTHRYSITFNHGGGSFVQISIRDAVATDSFLLSRPQLELGAVATDYKETVLGLPALSGKMYINLGSSLLENGSLRLDKISKPIYNDLRRIGDDLQFLQNADTFCDDGRSCNEVILPKGIMTINEQFSPSNNIVYRGAVQLLQGDDDTPLGQRGTVILANHTTPGVVFEYSPRDGGDTYYNGGLTDVEIIVNDTLTNVIDVTEVTGCIFENIIINADNAKANTGFKFQTNPGSDQYRNKIWNLQTIGSVDTAFFYEGSAQNEMGRFDFNGSNVGIFVNGGNQAFFSQYNAVQNCDIGLEISGGDVTIQGLYTEGSGINNGSVIKMSSGSLTLYNPTLQSETTSDTLWSISGGNHFTIHGGQIRTFGRVLTTGINSANFYQVGSTNPLSEIPVSSNMKRRINIYGNYNWITKEPFNNNRIRDHRIETGITNNNTHLNTDIADTLTLSETVIKGSKINFLGESEIFDSGTFIEPGGTDTTKVFSNATIAPDGTTTAELITYQGTDIGGGSIAWCDFPMLDSFEIGGEFVFTMYVYPHQDMPSGAGLFEIRPYSDEDNEVEFSFYAEANKWTRIPGVRGVISDNTGPSTMSIRFRNGLSSGDSLSVWGAYLKPGIHESTYIKTTTTGVNNESLSITISDQDSILHIKGGISIDKGIRVDSLLDSSGNFHYKSGLDTPTTDLSGQFTITHGLGTTPTHLSVGNLSGTEYNFEYSCGATSCTVTVYDGTGTDTTVNSTGISISWAAFR